MKINYSSCALYVSYQLTLCFSISTTQTLHQAIRFLLPINMMKLAVFLALVAVVSSGYVFPDFVSESITNCMIEHGIITQEALASKMSYISKYDECYDKCSLQSFQAVDKDGNFTPREYFLFLSADNPISDYALQYNLKSVKDCGFPGFGDACERAKLISQCINSRRYKEINQ